MYEEKVWKYTLVDQAGHTVRINCFGKIVTTCLKQVLNKYFIYDINGVAVNMNTRFLNNIYKIQHVLPNMIILTLGMSNTKIPVVRFVTLHFYTYLCFLKLQVKYPWMV